MGTPANEYPILLFEEPAAWEDWLEKNHATERGIRLRIAKKASALRSISFAEALDVALCFGWIDGQTNAYDADSYLQRFTLRGKRSLWSKRNREHVERLIAAGRMRPSGLAAIEAARADGRWDRAYDSPATAAIPADLLSALDANPAARAAFDALKSADRFSILHQLQIAVRPETRARRIEKHVARLARGERLHT